MEIGIDPAKLYLKYDSALYSVMLKKKKKEWGDVTEIHLATGRFLILRDLQPSNCGSADKESACNAGDLGLIPGLGTSPGEGKGYTQSSILAWRIPWTIQSLGVQRVGHNWATFTFTHSSIFWQHKVSVYTDRMWGRWRVYLGKSKGKRYVMKSGIKINWKGCRVKVV